MLLLKIIIFFLLVYLALKLLVRVVLPYYLKRKIEKAEINRQKAYRDYVNKLKKEEGKVTIDNYGKYRGNGSIRQGEYVDFEEIK